MPPAAHPLLVDPSWLAKHLDSPDLRVIDASWYLPDAGRDPGAEYRAAHIPGAVHLDLSTDLADPDAPARNTVASPTALTRAFSRAGIGSEHRVVVYDALGGYSAGRVWWTLVYAGQARVALLDGGMPGWQRAGLPLSDETPRHPPASFRAEPRPRWLAGREEVLRTITDRSAQIVDARSPARFRGEGPEPALRAGHMPGAINVPHDRNLSSDPRRFLEPGALRDLYEAAGVRFDQRVITTCGSGVTASLNGFALALAGHPDVAVYDGSWSEWGNDPALPVET